MELATKDDEVVDVVLLGHGKVLDKVQVDFNGKGTTDLEVTFENNRFVKAETPSGDIPGLTLGSLADVNAWWQKTYPQQFEKYAMVLNRFNAVE